MGWLREGDHLVVVAVDRLERSVREVATALHELTSRGVHVRSLREGVDTSTPTGRAVTSIMATIAELELELGKAKRQRRSLVFGDECHNLIIGGGASRF
jgi:DNA invertase Pin-like site-specific DNA recombinase